MKEKLLKGLKWFYRSYIWLGLVLLIIDIVTKQIMMALPHDSNGLISDWGFVHISFVLNKGAAFGIGTDNQVANRILYLSIASLIVAGITTYLILKRKTTNLYIRATLIMVITGALGNMIDRIFYGPLQGANGLFTGYVVDWIDFYWIWGYVFNIADCCIVIAAIMLIVYVIVGEVKDYQKREKKVVTQKSVLSKSEQERLEADKKASEASKEESK